jgi:hypothetical protein
MVPDPKSLIKLAFRGRHNDSTAFSGDLQILQTSAAFERTVLQRRRVIVSAWSDCTSGVRERARASVCIDAHAMRSRRLADPVHAWCCWDASTGCSAIDIDTRHKEVPRQGETPQSSQQGWDIEFADKACCGS